MVSKIGVLVRDLSLTQANYWLIRSANRIAGSLLPVDPIVFYEELSRPCTGMNFAQMQMAEAWAFDGLTIATTLSTASKLLDFPGPTHKAFYVDDLEWFRFRGFQFQDLLPIYSTLPLIARSKDHAQILRECWGGNVIGIIPRLDLIEVLKLFKS